MTGAPGFIEFFILEAGEYIEQIDGLLVTAGANEPDAEALQRLSRALRGSATMAKVTSFAGLAAAMERVGRALREGELQWDPSLRSAIVATVDDLRILLRSARAWSLDDDRRAGTRVAELTLYAPPRTSGAFRPMAERSSGGSSSFLGNESANIAAGLELLTTRPGDAGMAANVLGRIRALRGVAEVKEAGALAEVLEATEDAAHGLDTGETMSPEARQVLESATAYLRVLTPALRGSGDISGPSVARDAFSAAVAAWHARSDDAERVIPISELFYEDGSAGVVEAAAHPPTSAQARFRLEMVSLAEHLHAVVAGARQAFEPEAVERARRETIRAVRSLKASAESFAEHDTASRIADHLEAADRMNDDDLSALTDLATSLATPGETVERLTQNLHHTSVAETSPAPAPV
jgi:chemotaxis protein histidine kinase CheA